MKVLRPFTIIPGDLYVERAADRQLELILEDMGRPGYVLVARQMGKTNLLLHAKRKRENTKEVFTYLDVSNPFPDVRSFFRNIIDLVLETGSCIANAVKLEIINRRTEPQRLAHIEHEWELRQIIKSGIDKLIICLDEIDALTGSDYSDHVFSFIRSIYFSGRSNFPELSKLTYLLSGVAEPADIIKNKDISPFNIGEKIYLDDFSLKETEILAKNANIYLSDESLSRLYHWIQGYPRMTWDVCSKLEELQNNKDEINQTAIDTVVKNLYFTDVENPPIDHIKRIVEESYEIKDALMTVHYGKSKLISDSVRTKLYLAGISCFSAQGDSFKFKNAVLEYSLSEAYLRSLAKHSTHSHLNTAVEKIKSGQIHQGLEELKAININDFDENKFLVDLWCGIGQFELHEYEESIKYFDKIKNLSDTQITHKAIIYTGVAHYRNGNYKKAVETLSNYDNLPQEYRDYAAVWYAQSLIEIQENLTEAESIVKKIIASPSGLLNKQPFLRMPAEALAHCYITRALIYRHRKENQKAKSDLEQAVNYSTYNLRLKIYLLQEEMTNDTARTLWIRKATQIISSSSDFQLEVDGKGTSISAFQLAELLIRNGRPFTNSSAKEFFDTILQPKSSGLSIEELIITIVNYCAFRGHNSISATLLDHYISNHPGEGAFNIDFRQMMSLVIISNTQTTLKHWTSFIKYFGDNKNPYLNEIAALNKIALDSKLAIGSIKISTVLEIINREPADVTRITALQTTSLELLRRYLGIYLSLMKNPTAGDIASAKKLFLDLGNISSFDLPSFPTDYVRLMKEGLTTAMKRNGIKPELHKGYKFGRNEYICVEYNGEQVHGKYKKFEADLLAAKCKFIGMAKYHSK